MISKIAFFLIFGKPLLFYFGILTLLSFIFTAAIGFFNYKGNHKIPFKWHPRMVIISFIFALVHGLMGLSIYYNF